MMLIYSYNIKQTSCPCRLDTHIASFTITREIHTFRISQSAHHT